MHRLVLRFEGECRCMSDRNGMYHLKLKVVNVEDGHVLALVSFLEIALAEFDVGEVSIRYYLDGFILHLLVVFMESEYAAIRRSEASRVRSVDIETVTEEFARVASGSEDSSL